MKKVYYIKPNGKVIFEIIPSDQDLRDLVVVAIYKVNEVGAIIG